MKHGSPFDLLLRSPCGVQIWTRIMTDVAADSWMSANVIFDILNEPDSYGLTWGPNGKQLGGKGLGYWYHQIMTIGYGINSSALSHRLAR